MQKNKCPNLSQTLTQHYFYPTIIHSSSLREKVKRLSYYSLCSEHLSSFPPLCPVFVELEPGMHKNKFPNLAETLTQHLFYSTIIRSFSLREKAKNLSPYSLYSEHLSLFSPVFVDGSQGCTKTCNQTLPRLLRSIYFIQLLYIASVCTKKQSV